MLAQVSENKEVHYLGTNSEVSVNSTGSDLSTERESTNQRKNKVAVAAPASCAAMNPGTSVGRMPANVSLAERASVTAGLANEVDDVNQ